MRRTAPLLLLLLCHLTGSEARQRELTVKELTDRLQRRYETMTDAVARFTQRVRFSFSKLEQTFEGTLTMKKPNKFRIESEHQTLVTDGTTVWAYSPANRQVLIDRYKEDQNSITPDRFLLNLPTNYFASVLGRERLENVQTHTLKLVPKDDDAFVRSVKVWVEDGTWVLRKVVIVDVNETETTYTIRDIVVNTRVPDSVFSFQPPAGTEVVDLR